MTCEEESKTLGSLKYEIEKVERWPKKPCLFSFVFNQKKIQEIKNYLYKPIKILTKRA